MNMKAVAASVTFSRAEQVLSRTTTESRIHLAMQQLLSKKQLKVGFIPRYTGPHLKQQLKDSEWTYRAKQCPGAIGQSNKRMR